jgi:hypothetical protein
MTKERVDARADPPDDKGKGSFPFVIRGKQRDLQFLNRQN